MKEVVTKDVKCPGFQPDSFSLWQSGDETNIANILSQVGGCNWETRS